MFWKGNIYLDAALPFSLRYASKIFSALADALLWIMLQDEVSYAIHYLDNYLFAGPSPQGSSCMEQLTIAMDTCKRLGTHVAPEKLRACQPHSHT